MRAHFEREIDLEGPWSSYNASLGRPLLDSRKFLQGEKSPVKSSVEDSNAPATNEAAQTPASAPLLDLFSEQKA
jgi:hypothetical protein